MKKLFLIILPLLFGSMLHAQSTLLAGVQNRAVDYKSWGAWGSVENMYIYLPWDYYTSGKSYPIIIFFHGQGEVGNGGADLSKVLDNGLPEVINQGHPPYSVTDGDTTRFIVVSPQVFTNFFSAAFISGVWNTINHYNLNYDPNRIYVTGLSLGGEGAQNAVQAPSTTGFQPAAAVIMSPAHSISEANASYYENVPTWFFQGDNDGTVGQTGTIGYGIVSADYPSQAFKLTQYSGGHCCWIGFYDPTWNDNETSRNTPQTDNITIYDYMLRYSLNGTPANVHPVAHAGSDQALDPGTTSTTLTGSGTDSDGSIASYAWAKVGSNGATITSPSSSSTTITGLTDGNTYTFQLTVTDNEGATGTDQVTITVNEEETPPDTADYQIILSPTAKFWDGDTVFFQLNDLTSGGLVDSLIDEQLSDSPITTFTAGYPSHIDYPNVAVLDLGGQYKISTIKFYDKFGSDTLNILYGSPFHWSTDTIKKFENSSSWVEIPTEIYTRYLKVFYSNVGYQKIRELKLYGHLSGADSLTRIAPAYMGDTITQFTMGQFMGFNQIGPSEVDSVGQLMRHFLNTSWMDSATSTHNIDSVIFAFTTNGAPDATPTPLYYFFPGPPESETLKTGYIPTWGDYFDAIQGPPQYLIDLGITKPIDPVLHPDRDSTNALEYGRWARMLWNYTATYGRKAHPADSIQTPYPNLSGLNQRKYVEIGNEYNQGWAGKERHFSAQAYTALASASYDGHEGEMGPLMGVKNADSSMVVVMGGTAGLDTNYLRGINYYSYYTRKDHEAPFNIVNAHDYPTDGTNGSGSTDDAMSPETYFARGGMRNYVRQSHELFPGKPVWITEWGYDRNRATKLSVPPIPGKDSAQIQADWIARFWFFLSFSGVDRSTIFQLRNDALGTQYDSLGTTTFNTTGLADGHYVGNIYSDVNATSWYAYPAYYFQRAIWLGLYNYKPDAIIYNNHDSIWVFRYRSITNSDSVCYVFWSGTQSNRATTDYNIKTGHANTSVIVTELKDKYMTGLKYTPTTDADGQLNVVINESPKLLFTTEGTDGGQLVVNEDVPPVETPKAKAILYLLDNGKIVILNTK